MRIASIVTATLIAGSAIPACAQYFGYGGGVPYYGHASTAGEGYQRGFADVVRSAGQNNLLNSAAAKNYADARSKELDNRLKGTQTYFEMRRINQSYRDETRQPRLTGEQLHRIAAQGKPERPDPTVLDPVTGTIAWPLALRGTEYDALKTTLEQQFAQRAETSGIIGHDNYQAIEKTVGEALAALKENAKQYKPADYLQAKRFLESLAYEARFPVS